ncbi:MAG: hypothetical protein ACXVDD_20845, partial [Polyangia bacterium]
RRLVPVGDELREALLLPSRLVAVRAGELVTAPPSGAPLTSLRQSDRIRSIDAVAAGRETFVAGTDERALFVDRIDAAGKLAAHHVVRSEQPFALRLVRSSGGALALAWLAIEGDATALRFAWLDRDGNVKGKPVRVDTAPDRQIFANVTLAAHRDGVVVAWNPIVGKGDRETVLVELRAFGADAGGAPSLLRRVATTSQSWVVAGSAGGVLPNGLQALPFGRETALVWIAYERDKGGIDAVLVDGGAPLRLATVGGAPIARSDGKTATLLLEDQSGGNKSLTLRCEK